MNQNEFEFDVTAHRNIENQLCLENRKFESAMTQPGFEKRKENLLLDAQNTYWGALYTLMSMDKPEASQFAPIHAELRRLRSTLTAFKM